MSPEERELKKITDHPPSAWPHNPVLPMKNYKDRKPGEFPKMGSILAEDVERGEGVTVYEKGPWESPVMEYLDFGDVIQAAVAVKESGVIKTYGSLKAMVEDGWIID